MTQWNNRLRIRRIPVQTTLGAWPGLDMGPNLVVQDSQ